MKKPPLVSIITVNFNQCETTCSLLDTIQRQGYRNIELIVVDNASVINPEQAIHNRYPNARFIRSERNLGFAGGNNLGIAQATGEYLFFINNDTELTYYCIDRLVSFCTQHDNCGAVSPLICYYNETPGETDIIQYAGMTLISPRTARNTIIGERQSDAGQFLLAKPTAYTHGAAMMVPRAVVDQVGYMPEEYFLYYEELDWCEQMRRAGYTIWVEPTARIYHKESLTVSKMGALKTYFMVRNRILFVKRNYPRHRWLFYFYLWWIVAPKSVLLFALKGETENIAATWKALMWFFTGTTNKYEVMSDE